LTLCFSKDKKFIPSALIVSSIMFLMRFIVDGSVKHKVKD